MEITSSSFERIGIDPKASEQIVRPSIGYWGDAFRRFKKNKVAVGCAIYLILIILGSIIIPMVSPYTISEQNLDSTYASPMQGGHIFGTDDLGRDLFVRVWFGARITLLIAFSAAILDFIIGIIYGGIAGYVGGKVDTVMMRIVDIISAIPYLIAILYIYPTLHI